MNPSPDTYEKLGAFYLGREYDLGASTLRDELLLYDSKDLTTHAVCVGMTGSGKTGLCVSLLEEAAIDGIPALVLDPKGDLTNLLLTFPGLAASDFLPWINADDAARQGLTPERFAASQAKLWRDGLGVWGQSGERIDRLRAAADFAIYTPGSEAGRPLSVLSSFSVPAAEVRDDTDAMREQVANTATSLLAMMGIAADPLRSRDHILLSILIEQTWQQGRDLDLGRLIQLIQTPSVTRVGMLDLESFYPRKERFELALALNNLLAAPAFASWMSGEPMDIHRLLFDARGRPRLSIIYMAHLSDAERMFVVSLLLNRMVGWMRGRSGTTSLRALVYMDEIFGYMPPVAEPPSKQPLLTLLKQARAYGVGVVLATQNPVDLDYKGLSNTGTWFLGRLQTERDKRRVLDGLEGAAASVTGFDRGAMEETLAGLGKRVFLMHNVHEDAPVVFHTRWAMSYLRGPLTRQQIRALTPETATDAGPVSTSTPATAPTSRGTATAATIPHAAGAPGGRPVLPPGVPCAFLPLRSPLTAAKVTYVPKLAAIAEVHFVDSRRGVRAQESIGLIATIGRGPATAFDWADGAVADLETADLLARPPLAGDFGELPAVAAQPRSYATWNKSLCDWLYRTRRYDLFKAPLLTEYSKPGEGEAEFRIRLSEASREARDVAVETLRHRYASKFNALRERIRKAEMTVQRETEQARGAGLQTAISVGTTLLAAMLGRKRVSTTTIGKATTAARGVGRTMAQRQDIARATANLEAARQQLAALEDEFASAVSKLQSRFEPARLELETVSLKPRRADVQVRALTLAWVPHEAANGTLVDLA